MTGGHRTTGRLTTGILVVALLAGAVVATAFALHDAPSPDPAAEPRVITPLWSARRLPEPAREELGTERLRFELALLLDGVGHCVVVDEDDRRLVASGVDTALIPASTLKLLTGLAALAVLGPDHRFVTRAVAAAAPDDGVVETLHLVGGGDPLLATPEYEAYLAGEPRWRDDPTTSLAELADEIVAAGVRSVPGGVVGDDSRHEGLRYLPGWDPSYLDQGVISPLSALTVDDGLVAWEDGNVPADEPAAHAAGELARLLEERGVAVGDSSAGAAPTGVVDVAAVDSPPLAEVVAAFERSSDNLGGELLVREIGLAARGEGTTAAGLAATSQTLDELGVGEQRTLVDGSGLHRDNRIACGPLVDVLEAARRAELRAVREGLPVAGVSGTLAERLGGTELEDRLRAKTGTLNGVTGLAGLLTTLEGRELEFAFLANDAFSEAEGEALGDAVAAPLVAYPDAPAADELVPAP